MRMQKKAHKSAVVRSLLPRKLQGPSENGSKRYESEVGRLELRRRLDETLFRKYLTRATGLRMEMEKPLQHFRHRSLEAFIPKQFHLRYQIGFPINCRTERLRENLRSTITNVPISTYWIKIKYTLIE